MIRVDIHPDSVWYEYNHEWNYSKRSLKSKRTSPPQSRENNQQRLSVENFACATVSNRVYDKHHNATLLAQYFAVCI